MVCRASASARRPRQMDDKDEFVLPRHALGSNGMPYLCFRPSCQFRKTDTAAPRYVGECWCSWCSKRMKTHRNWGRHLHRCHYPRSGAGTPGCIEEFAREADDPPPVMGIPMDDLPEIPPYAHAALVLLSVPCHEAAAERLFSTLEWLFESRRRRASPSLLRNEMIVRMCQVYTGQPAGLPLHDVV